MYYWQLVKKKYFPTICNLVPVSKMVKEIANYVGQKPLSIQSEWQWIIKSGQRW